MSTKYRISEQDYVDASKLFGKLTFRQSVIFALAILMLLVLALFDFGNFKSTIVAGICIWLAFFVFGRHLISPMMVRSQYKKYKAIHDEFEIRLLEDSVFIASSSGSGKILWNTINKWREDENYVLIYPMPRLYYIIPKSLKANGFDIPLLVKQLSQHVGKSV
jgi:hypothetical protein